MQRRAIAEGLIEKIGCSAIEGSIDPVELSNERRVHPSSFYMRTGPNLIDL